MSRKISFENLPLIAIGQFEDVFENLGDTNRVTIIVTISDFVSVKKGQEKDFRRTTWQIDSPDSNERAIMVAWGDEGKY
jgi:hypothetical protein